MFRKTFSIPERNFVCRNKFIVSKLKEENVVKPPRKPIKINWRKIGIESSRCSLRENRIPMMQDPITFTARVPCGKWIPKT
jgi:hypothetical protein